MTEPQFPTLKQPIENSRRRNCIALLLAGLALAALALDVFGLLP